MLFRLPLLVLLLSTAFRSLAQTFEPGWLLPPTGDTLRVAIENNFWLEPPTEVRFQAAPGAAIERRMPRQVRAFGLTGGRCFRYAVLPIDHAADTRLDRLPRGNFTDVRADSVLAEVLLDGPLAVLRVRRPGTLHYFFVRDGQPPLPLTARSYLRQATDGSWQATDGNNYRGQLLQYFGGCPAAFQAAQRAEFTADDLVDAAQQYNRSCSPTRQPGRSYLAQARPRHPVAFRYGLLAGLRYNRIKSMSAALAGGCVDCQPRPFGGLYAELLQPSRQSAVYGELSLSRFRSTFLQSAYSYSGLGPVVDEVFDYSAWLGTARLGVRYFVHLPREQQLLLGFGFELNKVMGANATSRTGTIPRPFADTEYQYAVPTWLPNLTVGWRRQRLTVSLDGQSYTQWGDDEYINVFFGSGFALRLGVGYGLGRNPDQQPK